MSDTVYSTFQHYGTNAERLAFAPDPAAGIQPVYIWYETDTGDVYLYDSSWHLVGGAAVVSARKQVVLIVDGFGTVITTGVKGYLSLPVSGTWKKWRLLSTGIDVSGPISGSIVIDIWKDTYANYPPTVADTITASTKPTLSSAIKDEDSSLSGWDTSFDAGDILGFNVDSVTDLTKVFLALEYEES